MLSLLCGVAVLLWPLLVGLLQDLCISTSILSPTRCASAPGKLFSYVAVLSLLPAMLIIERFWPAVDMQPVFSPGLMVDFIWFCATPVFLVLFIIPIEEALRWAYSYLGYSSVLSVLSLPFWAQVVFVILLSDFLFWLAHVIRHKSKFVWEFHKIHHAQQEMNFFCGSRAHPIDSLVVNLVRFLPFTMLEADAAVTSFVVWKVVVNGYAMYTHSNIRTNMGLLKYVLVTPQSHRVHHSDRLEHQDKNFGNIFVIWDMMFGTQVFDFSSYPDTGTEDKNVPRPESARFSDAARSFCGMLGYPFRSLSHQSLAADGRRG